MGLLSELPTGLAAIFWGVITFSILIVLHEGGHFFAARAFGVKVHEFMLGLPGPALRWRSKRTGVVYGVTAVPLGGYVRIAGMEPGPEDELLAVALGHIVDRGRMDADSLCERLGVPRERAAAIIATLEDYGALEPIEDWPESLAVVERAEGESDEELFARVRRGVYRAQSLWKRVTILAMGVLVNLVTAVLVFTVVLSAFGYRVPSDAPVIGSVSEKGAAAAAGVRVGDRVLAIDGRAVRQWADISAAIRAHDPGQSAVVELRRGTRELTVRVTLREHPERAGAAFMGVGSASRQVRMPIGAAFMQSIEYIGLTFVAIGSFFDPSTFAESVSNARSVVGISYEVARAAEAGPLQYAAMIALLSLSLGVMNILPIPPLDGGKVAVELIEALMRRQIPRAVSYAVSGVGAALLFSLIFYLMYADVVRYIVRGS